MTEKKRGRPKGVPLIQVLAIKGLPEWRDWLQDLANHLGVSSSEAIDQALVDLAAKVGFRPPPKRTG